MRYETCLNCRYGKGNNQPGDGAARLRQVATGAETMIGRDIHHHHVIECGDCGSWWFDDAVLSPLGIPVPSRRDTVLCGCPEDGRETFTETVVFVRGAEDRCHCDRAALTGGNSIDITLGGQP